MGWGSRLAAIACILFVLGLGPATAEVRVSRDEGRSLAAALLADGEPAAARDIALTLLDVDAGDVAALVLLSRAERALGRFEASRQAAARAWAAAETEDERFSAAVVRGQALATPNPGPLGLFWMRRAVELAPTEAAASLARGEAEAIRRASPLRVNLNFGIAPDSNVNNGGANALYELHPDVADAFRDYLGDPTLDVQGSLVGDELPLSGLEISAGAALTYRLAETRERLTELHLSLTGATYVLSQEARDTVPDADGRDFANLTLAAGLSHRRLSGEASIDAMSVTTGRQWYGGEPYATFARLSYGRTWRQPGGRRIAVEGALGLTGYDDAGVDDERDAALSLRWASPVGSSRLTLFAEVTDVASDTADRAYRSLALEGSLAFGEARAAAVTLGIERRVYDETFYIDDTRRDTILTARVSRALPDWDLYGFVPVLSLEGRQVRSNADRPETESLGAGLTFLSQF